MASASLVPRAVAGRPGHTGPTLRFPSPRILLLAAPLLAALLGTALTGGDDAARAAIDAGPELTRLLRLMVLLKCTLGAGALYLVWLRFRFAVTPRLAAAYVAAGTVMASGPGVMWHMAHIGIGALLFHGGLAALFVIAWVDGGTTWRLGRG